VSGGASAGNNMQAVKEKTVGCHVRKENGRNKLGLCVLEKKLGPVPKAYTYFMGMYSQFLTILK
jgi:hypothetical protein